MAIDTQPNTEGIPKLLGSPTLHEPGRFLGSRARKRALLAVAASTVVALAVAFIAGAMSSPSAGPKLTHTISRGDLLVTVIEQGLLESAENTEIKCKVRGQNTVIWIIDSGTFVEPGDELIRLDTRFIEEQIDERTKYAHWSRSSAEHSKAQLARAELAVSEYVQGRYVAELMSLEKDWVIAESKLNSAREILRFTRQLADSRYVSELEIEEKEFAVTQAELDVKLKQTEIDVLKRFTRAEQLQTLDGNLAATKANHEANAERAIADASRRDRALEEFKHCVITADRSGFVIHPSAAKWETTPIAQGSNVHKDQVLLLIPDLAKMQVKVGIHESTIDRVKVGLSARVTLPDKTINGTVSSVASVTRPASWWTGNEVRYDTTIALPANEGLMPGMSAEVEVLIARYEDVLKIPVAAIVDSDDGKFCWLKTVEGIMKRPLVLDDSNGVFSVVKEGVREGDEVVLNPLALEDTP